MSMVRRTRGAAVALAFGVAASACGRATTGPEEGPGFATGPERVSFDVGVTREPCPEGPSEDHGCIYLGILTDLSEGPFASFGLAVTDGQKAFWKRVNEHSGIADSFDVNVTNYIRDHKSDPEETQRLYDEVKGKVLAFAQTMGGPQTAAILDDLKQERILAMPASWSSLWEFEDVIMESGASYCVGAMNAIDYAVQEYNSKKVMAIHYAGEDGEDGAAGVKIAADAHKLEFTDVETPIGPDKQAPAIAEVVRRQPNMVFISTSPADMAAIVGNAVAQGYKGRFMGHMPAWMPELIHGSAAGAIKQTYEEVAPWKTFHSAGTGYDHMRVSLGSVPPNDGYTSGWVWSYPLKAALERAVRIGGDVTREGLFDAASEMTNVDYEGMLPDDAGDFAGEASETVFRESLINSIDTSKPTGLNQKKDFFIGETAEKYELTEPCYEAVK